MAARDFGAPPSGTAVLAEGGGADVDGVSFGGSELADAASPRSQAASNAGRQRGRIDDARIEKRTRVKHDLTSFAMFRDLEPRVSPDGKPRTARTSSVGPWTSRAAACVLFVTLAGCQRLDQSAECRKVSELVNPVLTAIDRERQKDPEDAHTYRAIAMQYESLEKTLSGLKLRTRRLSEALTEYGRVLREGARDARQFADALDAKDAPRIAAMRGAAAHTVKHEGSTLARIDQLCRGK